MFRRGRLDAVLLANLHTPDFKFFAISFPVRYFSCPNELSTDFGAIQIFGRNGVVLGIHASCTGYKCGGSPQWCSAKKPWLRGVYGIRFGRLRHHFDSGTDLPRMAVNPQSWLKQSLTQVNVDFHLFGPPRSLILPILA